MKRKMQKVLIANRGEIAVRIIRACRELGMQTVAVFSDADKDSLHAMMADEKVHIGKASPSKSYLNIDNIINAAKHTQADAIHPGYGFLAENDEFSDACAKHNIIFVGPSGEVIRKMGNKVAARDAAVLAGVPVVPGTEGEVRDIEEAIQVGESMGYPVLLKAAAGGGGRGMQLAYNEQELREHFVRIKAEAQAAFGDASLYMEKYIVNARHVEVQVLFDQYGNGIHLGERDCSVQRRHQKLIEEAPCPVIDEELRVALTESAVKIAQSESYTGAGTVEYLVDLDEKRFYFIEMNTRVQVEHPVTEMITGVDIVKEQLRIAAGELLSVTQQEVRFQGHALECRINAENPFEGFSPSPGKITKLVYPAGPGVRVDSHCYQGYAIPVFYDSMIGKIIVTGRDREETVARMKRALKEMEVGGISTTIPFHLKVLEHPNFLSNEYNTRWTVNSLLRELGNVASVKG